MSSKKKKKKNKSISKTKAVILGALGALVVTACVCLIYVLGSSIIYVSGDLQVDLEEYKENQNQTSFIYAYDDNNKPVEIARLHGDEDRVWVDLENISPYMSKAFIALEDTRFDKHHGVDWIRVAGVIVKPSQLGQGGSTITQQLIKNITNNKQVTIKRKFYEILMALNLEKHYDKDTIMEAYLNTVYLGNGCYGVKTASEKYFGKDISELTAAECASLASITKFPTKYNPLINPENNKVRYDYCLEQMKNTGLINQAEYDDAISQTLIFTNSPDYIPENASDEIKKLNEEETKVNSFYVDFVIDSVIDDLMDEYGYSQQQATNMIYYGGLKIYSAVDMDIQEELEDVYVNRISFPNIYSKDDGSLPQSSMTIMDYAGRVVAIVGKAGEKTANRTFNRATNAWRQPGSTIKPLSTYAPAIDLDLINYSSKEKDYAIAINGELWPHNVDKTLGSGNNVSMEYAIQKSLNTVPARLISEKITPTVSVNYLKNHFHLSRVDESKDSSLAPLATGAFTNGTTTLEMAAAYATFGNGGLYFKPYSYYKVTNARGTQVLLSNENVKGEQAISSETSDIMCELLQKVDTSYYGTGSNVRKFQIMAKTGTTTSDCDRWFCAGTPYYVASVWFGFDIKESLNQDVNPCGKIFITVFDRIHKDLEPKEFPKSSGVVKKTYCRYTGKLAGSHCSSTGIGWYKLNALPGTCTSCTSSSAIISDTVEEVADIVIDAASDIISGIIDG